MFCRLPYGTKESPADITEALQKVLYGLEESVVAYLDDVLILFSSFSQHLEHLPIVLKRIARSEMTLKLSKCEFMKSEVRYLGYGINEEGISVLNIPMPRNKTQLLSAPGVVNYFKDHIINHASVYAPLYGLTKDHVFPFKIHTC